VVVHGRKKRIVGRCKTIPHIREVHLGAIRQDVSSAIRMLEWMMPRIVNKGGNTTITLSINQMPAHTHEIGEAEDSQRRFQSRTSGQDIGIGTSGYTSLTSTGNNAGGRSPIATSVGGSQPIDVRSPYFGLPYIIRVS